MKIDIIAGARPNFMKIAPIARAIDEKKKQGEDISFRIVHTGQHFDKNMSSSFFEQLDIPHPDVNLGAGGGTQAEQTGAIMLGYEKLIRQSPTDLCLVVGDVTSTMACAIVAQKQGVKVAHVEAGIRSGDWGMPEEINRIVTDSITNYFFTTTQLAGENLMKSGINTKDIFLVGNTMIDTLLRNRKRFTPPEIWNTANLEKGKYLVVTLHRPSNVDQEKNLEILLHKITEANHGLPVVFPVHPRTLKTLEKIEAKFSNLHFTSPLPYLEFNYLVENAMGVITDSGGITEETTVMRVPCMTLRDSTERPETVTMGTNELLGTDPTAITEPLKRLVAGKWKSGSTPELWDGKTAERIVSQILKF